MGNMGLEPEITREFLNGEYREACGTIASLTAQLTEATEAAKGWMERALKAENDLTVTRRIASSEFSKHVTAVARLRAFRLRLRQVLEDNCDCQLAGDDCAACRVWEAMGMDHKGEVDR